MIKSSHTTLVTEDSRTRAESQYELFSTILSTRDNWWDVYEHVSVALIESDFETMAAFVRLIEKTYVVELTSAVQIQKLTSIEYSDDPRGFLMLQDLTDILTMAKAYLLLSKT